MSPGISRRGNAIAPVPRKQRLPAPDRVRLPNLDPARSLVPKLCLGTHVRESFCFASGRGSDAKRSFADQRSQAELGNEGQAAAPKSRGTPPDRRPRANLLVPVPSCRYP